nr:5-formyltetrahydrofolate cyclo-ligase [uncultured Capnocytophaga sp.]
MTKKELRTLYKQKRNALSAEERDLLSRQIAERLLLFPNSLWEHHTYHIFLPIERLAEINTNYILNILRDKNKQIAVPKMDSNTRTLSSILLTKDTQLINNAWGIPEPKQGVIITPETIDVVFVPLLAYDKYGNRIGYGGGYYDRFLNECRGDTLKIGLSYFPPENNFYVLRNTTDIFLDYAITPSANYTLTKREY